MCNRAHGRSLDGGCRTARAPLDRSASRPGGSSSLKTLQGPRPTGRGPRSTGDLPQFGLNWFDCLMDTTWGSWAVVHGRPLLPTSGGVPQRHLGQIRRRDAHPIAPSPRPLLAPPARRSPRPRPPPSPSPEVPLLPTGPPRRHITISNIVDSLG